MNDIDRIIEKLKSNDLVIWAGSGISKYCNLPTGSELVEIIRNKMDSAEQKECEKIYSLPEIAQKYVSFRSNSKNELIRLLKNIFDVNLDNVKYHKLLTDIPYISQIIIRSFDRYLKT